MSASGSVFRRLQAIFVTTLGLSLAVGLPPAASRAAVDPPAGLDPVDAQAWVDQGELTWAAYTPVFGQPAGWRDGSIRGSQNDYSGAAVLLDFTDQPFLTTQPPESHPFGNPQPGWSPIPRTEVAQWMEDYLNTPNQYNGGQSITGYWMEDSFGRISVDMTAFGPYMLPGKVHEYGLADFAPVTGLESRCPLGDVCNKAIRTDGLALWRAAAGPTIDTQFDVIFYVTAGHDESSTWQEFGEMMFQTQNDVPAAFGPPGAGGPTPPLNNAGQPMPNWSPTRYVPWTSWRAAGNHWPNASGNTTTQAESSGQSVYAHEFSHVRGLPDNYNNPFANNQRAGTAYWEMMSRGTFNGPGGTHNRWQVPNAGGSGLGPHHMVKFKQQLGILTGADQLVLNRADLTTQGIAVLTLQARESPPDAEPVALQIMLGAAGYTSGQCQSTSPGSEDPAFWCPPGTNWTNYSLEVVDRVGNDSFAPGHGVLLAQNRASGTPSAWVIDANPPDIGMIDFYRPDGTPAPVVRGDPRQLNDATFHAGTDSGSEFEYVENFNRLHFYVLEKIRDPDGVLTYRVAVRNLDGAGPFARGVGLGTPTTSAFNETTTLVEVPLTNTGQAGTGIYASDVYRITASFDAPGWEVWLPYEVRAAEAGQTVPVQAYVTGGDCSAQPATLTLTATSEVDPSVTQTVTLPLCGGAPIAVDDLATTVNGFPVRINVLANDSDPNGDVLTVTGVTDPPNGTAVNNGDGTVTYRPDCRFLGIDTFTYTIDDGNGGTDTGLVTVQNRKTSRRGSIPAC
jgi:M6 family metalloprotease-like protein